MVRQMWSCNTPAGGHSSAHSRPLFRGGRGNTLYILYWRIQRQWGRRPNWSSLQWLKFILRVLIVQIRMQPRRYPLVVTIWCCIMGKKGGRRQKKGKGLRRDAQPGRLQHDRHLPAHGGQGVKEISLFYRAVCKVSFPCRLHGCERASGKSPRRGTWRAL